MRQTRPSDARAHVSTAAGGFDSLPPLGRVARNGSHPGAARRLAEKVEMEWNAQPAVEDNWLWVPSSDMAYRQSRIVTKNRPDPNHDCIVGGAERVRERQCLGPAQRQRFAGR